MYKQVTINITTLSHLHIGCGEFYTNLDYYIENGKAKILDIEKMLESLDDITKINKIVNLIRSRIRHNRMECNIKDICESMNINPERFILRELTCKIKKNRRIQVEKFIQNKNIGYYIPGSSIKGAIRTAYIFDYYDDKEKINELVNILKNKKIFPHQKGKCVVEKAIGKIENDFFKYLLITDSDSIDPSNFEFIETRRYNLKSKTYGNLECKEALKSGVKLVFNLTIKEEFPKSFEEIKKICNNFVKHIAEFEIKNTKLPRYLKEFYEDKILGKLNDNEAFLAIGSGSGFLLKSIYILLHKYNKDLNLIKNLLPKKRNQKIKNYFDFPQTRVIDVEEEKPLGWIKIEKVSEG